MRVSSILSSKGSTVATTAPTAPLVEAINELRLRGVGALVVSGDGRHIDGIVSERDIVRGIGEKGIDILRRPVSDLMTKNVVTCSEQHSLDEMMGVMTQGRFRHVPVVVDGKLAGIISIGDVVKHHIAAVQLEVTAMREYLATG